jgi:Flp pilus assembly protein TadD
MPADWAKEFSVIADGYMAMPLEVRMRFGRWDEIPRGARAGRALPDRARTAPLRARRGVRRQGAARRRQRRARGLPHGSRAGPGHRLLRHRRRRRAARHRRARARRRDLREGAALEDALRYDEPPDWILPVRHALGATLLQEGRFSEAETVFRAGLAIWPDDGWALLGLARSLRLQGLDAEAGEVEERLATVFAKADVQPSSACYCQPGR